MSVAVEGLPVPTLFPPQLPASSTAVPSPQAVSRMSTDR